MTPAPRPIIKVVLLALTAMIFGGGGAYLWLNLGNNAASPALLGALIAITCILRIVTLLR